MKNIHDSTYKEIFEINQYQQSVEVNDGDFVLDLGCSQGPFYFKNYDKDIVYVGVDASVNCINDFYNNLEGERQPLIINAFVSESLQVQDFSWSFYDEHQKVSSITFPSLLKFLNRKIDFLKFDIESYEKTFLVTHYDLFKKNVKKFAGEIHFCGNDFFPRNEVYDMMDKLKNDASVNFKIYSIDGYDISEYFWGNRDYYTEVIINGTIV
tara:strand:+ start:576 stop:1205 length:630 start_codon:yes stop_codon:yes gene_type:complete